MGELISIDNNEGDQKWIRHYCSSHKILLVGEGDFSFAACLAKRFDTAANMIATSFDSEEFLMQNYSNARTNLEELKERGCTTLHNVNAHSMILHPLLNLKVFDRIIYNFPHAGFMFSEHDDRQIELHQELVKGFLRNAFDMLTEDGEIHITHKTTHPFSNWKLEKLAKEIGLCLLEEVEFSKWDYPGYVNKRGSGSRINNTFPVGECSTFKFVKPYFAERSESDDAELSDSSLIEIRYLELADQRKNDNNEGDQKWIQHYCSSHKILLVGEGDFSFAACLAKRFDTTVNMIATSFDSEEFLMQNYSNARTNLEELKERRCTTLHNVNAHTMILHPLLNLKVFDRIIFNFPHAGFMFSEHDDRQIELHQELVRGFLRNAFDMLTEDGEIHITQKTAYPFSNWKIKKLAKKIGLRLLEEVKFCELDYPGYVNKRGSGSRIDDTFPIGECSTFKFVKPCHRS
ncbi:hypothetical protein I3843_11G202800 [Carya illinoinensis]|nr:hypothetical protein I3843_11G202800 [Carya illinoinensis]